MSRAALAVIAALLTAAGCGGPEVAISEGYHASPPLRVAVLPFVSPDDDEDTLDKVDFVRRTFYRHFAGLPFIHMDLDMIDRKLREAGLLDAAAVSRQTAARLGELLGADAVVFGELDAISNIAPLLAYYRSVGGRVRMVGVRAEAELVDVTHNYWESGGPLVESGQVISGVMNQIKNTTNLAFIGLAEKWASEIVERVPPPRNADRAAIEAAQTPPRLESFELRGSREGTLGPGDRVLASVSAEPDLRVEVELGLAEQLTLFEVSPGTYEGTYLVQVGDRVSVEAVTAIAINMYGQKQRKVLQRGLVIDARPPGAPSGLEAEDGDGAVALAWQAVAHEGAAVRYVVYRADSASPGAFARLGETASPGYRDATVAADRTYRYQVVAVAGRMHSYPSAPAEIER